MPVEIRCPNCSRKYSVTEKHIGRRVICADATCGTRFIATVEQLKDEEFVTEEYLEAVDNPTDDKSDESARSNQPADFPNESASDQSDHEIVSSQRNEASSSSSEVAQTESDCVVGQEQLTGLVLDTGDRGQTQLWGMAKKAFGNASIRVSNAGIAVTSKAVSYGSTGIAKATEVGKQTFNAANSAIDSSGAKEAIKATASVVSEKLDEASGKRLVELVKKKLQIQDSYNDILATRLAEALDRIKTLEDRVNKLTPQSSSTPMSPAEIQR